MYKTTSSGWSTWRPSTCEGEFSGFQHLYFIAAELANPISMGIEQFYVAAPILAIGFSQCYQVIFSRSSV
jgi:hypothetical protein